jgi:hypothetical protein
MWQAHHLHIYACIHASGVAHDVQHACLCYSGVTWCSVDMLQLMPSAATVHNFTLYCTHADAIGSAHLCCFSMQWPSAAYNRTAYMVPCMRVVVIVVWWMVSWGCDYVLAGIAHASKKNTPPQLATPQPDNPNNPNNLTSISTNQPHQPNNPNSPNSPTPQQPKDPTKTPNHPTAPHAHMPTTLNGLRAWNAQALCTSIFGGHKGGVDVALPRRCHGAPPLVGATAS